MTDQTLYICILGSAEGGGVEPCGSNARSDSSTRRFEVVAWIIFVDQIVCMFCCGHLHGQPTAPGLRWEFSRARGVFLSDVGFAAKGVDVTRFVLRLTNVWLGLRGLVG
ncbi:unnamed protein product, partial [Ectocarpus sp. 8 AP-2014]